MKRFLFIGWMWRSDGGAATFFRPSTSRLRTRKTRSSVCISSSQQDRVEARECLPETHENEQSPIHDGPFTGEHGAFQMKDSSVCDLKHFGFALFVFDVTSKPHGSTVARNLLSLFPPPSRWDCQSISNLEIPPLGFQSTGTTGAICRPESFPPRLRLYSVNASVLC
jgi:hypothetical protein